MIFPRSLRVKYVVYRWNRNSLLLMFFAWYLGQARERDYKLQERKGGTKEGTDLG